MWQNLQARCFTRLHMKSRLKICRSQTSTEDFIYTQLWKPNQGELAMDWMALYNNWPDRASLRIRMYTYVYLCMLMYVRLKLNTITHWPPSILRYMGSDPELYLPVCQYITKLAHTICTIPNFTILYLRLANLVRLSRKLFWSRIISQNTYAKIFATNGVNWVCQQKAAH